MKQLSEWSFEFTAHPDPPTTEDHIAELLTAATDWADSQTLMIGGGFSPVDKGEGGWQFDFRLCVIRED